MKERKKKEREKTRKQERKIEKIEREVERIRVKKIVREKKTEKEWKNIERKKPKKEKKRAKEKNEREMAKVDLKERDGRSIKVISLTVDLMKVGHCCTIDMSVVQFSIRSGSIRITFSFVFLIIKLNIIKKKRKNKR